MNLTKKQAEKIAEKYNLGEVKKFRTFTGGWVNHNFLLATGKGRFVVQILTRKMDDWGKGKMKLQFKVLNYLKKKNFPYEIPVPFKNKDGKYLCKLGKENLWVYHYIEGRIYWNKDIKRYKELMKAVALYHKLIKGFKHKKKLILIIINGFMITMIS